MKEIAAREAKNRFGSFWLGDDTVEPNPGSETKDNREYPRPRGLFRL